jgi:hypothetical protein
MNHTGLLWIKESRKLLTYCIKGRRKNSICGVPLILRARQPFGCRVQIRLAGKQLWNWRRDFLLLTISHYKYSKFLYRNSSVHKGDFIVLLSIKHPSSSRARTSPGRYPSIHFGSISKPDCPLKKSFFVADTSYRMTPNTHGKTLFFRKACMIHLRHFK